MKYQILSEKELKEHVCGEVITLTTVLSVMAAAVMAVIIYRLFLSNEGGVTIPGGWKFSWDD